MRKYTAKSYAVNTGNETITRQTIELSECARRAYQVLKRAHKGKNVFAKDTNLLSIE